MIGVGGYMYNLVNYNLLDGTCFTESLNWPQLNHQLPGFWRIDIHN